MWLCIYLFRGLMVDLINLISFNDHDQADDAKAKFEERERKKLEIRKRLEAQMKSTKKKGFMNPERKKRLRVSNK